MTDTTKPSLREEIQMKLRILVLAHVAKLPDEEAVTEITDAILATVIKELEGRLPKVVENSFSKTDEIESYNYMDGYNHALNLVKFTLKEMGS